MHPQPSRLGTCGLRHERSQQERRSCVLCGPACSVPWIRASTCVMWGVWGGARARVCVGEAVAQFCGAGSRVRKRAHRDLRRPSPSRAGAPAPPTPAVCSLRVNPVGAARVLLDEAIGRGPAQVRVSGGLVRAVCSAWRSSQCGSRGLHGCTWRHVCACDRRAGGGAGERRRAWSARRRPTGRRPCVYLPADDLAGVRSK